MNRHHDPNPFDEEEVNPFSVIFISLSPFFAPSPDLCS